MRTLQLPETYEPSSPTRSYRDIAISLMAALANADGILLPAELEAYTTAAGSMLGRSMGSALTRAAVLDAFVRPPDPSVTVEDLQRVMRDDGVSNDGRLAVATHLVAMLEGTRQADLSGIRLVRSLIDALGVPMGELGRRLDEVQARVPASLAGATGPVESAPSESTIRRAFSSVASFWRSSPTNQSQRASAPSLVTAQGQANDAAVAACRRVLKLGQAIGSSRLVAKAEEFLNQLQPHGCRIALVGEMKHGKSSVFNLLLGTDLSPTGASTATTSAVVEMHYSSQPIYEGRWLGEESLQSLRRYISDNLSNRRVADFGQLLEQAVSAPEYTPGGTISGLDSLSAMADYVTAKGSFACAVERVRIGLPLEVLKGGAVIVDSPGLNDPMRVRDHITLEEAKKADCVCFVLRADKLGTESERRFLVSLLNAGRAVSLLVVVTHLDRLSGQAEVDRVLDAAASWVSEIADEARAPRAVAKARVFGICALREGGGKSVDSHEGRGFEAFRAELARIAADPLRGGSYSQWVAERTESLEVIAKEESEAYQQRLLSMLPTEETLRELASTGDEFLKLATSYRKQIGQRLESVRERIEFERKQLLQDLAAMREQLSNELRGQVEQLVRQLGDDYHREEKWTQFNQTTSALLLRTRFGEFEARNRDKMELWERELRRFSEELELQVSNSLSQLSAARSEFANVCATSHFFDAFAAGVDKTVSTARTGSLLAVGAYSTVAVTWGAATGSWAMFSAIASLASGGTAVPIIAGVAAAGMLAHKLLSNPEKRKMKFIEKKVEAADEWLRGRMEPLEKHLASDLEHVWERFVSIAESRYAPLVREALANAAEARLRASVAERIRKDVERYSKTLLG